MKRITAVALLLLASLAAVAQTSGSANAQGLMTASGSACLVTSTNCVLLPLPSGAASANVVLSGTFSATVQFELSADGVTFVAANALPQPSGTAVSSATATGTWAIPLAGMAFLRARCSAFTSGTIGAYLQSSQAGAATVSLPAFVPAVAQSGLLSPQTPITASNTGAASAANTTLAAAAGKTTYITGFQITGAGATAASIITVTVTGTVTGTMNYNIVVPAGATTSITPLLVSFPVPVPASAVNTAIVVNVPSFGTGNTNSAVSAQGFQQ